MKRTMRGLALGLAIGFAAILLAGTMVSKNLALEGTYTYLKLFNEALSLIRSSYVDEVETQSLMKGAYDGLLSELDPFSEYLTAEEYAEYLEKSSATGSGRAADAGLRVAKKDGVALVVAVRPGSDAASKGITPGDHLRRIGDRSTREMALYQIDAALSGAPGTTVTVSVARREEPRKIDAELSRREIAPAPATLEIVAPNDGIAVLRLPEFGARAGSEVAAALDRASKARVRRLLVDLRGNAWGTVDSAAECAGLFVGEALVARLKSKETVVEEVRSHRGRAPYDGMVAVLANGATAEAAELFAAALHDGRGATLLGETSFGVGAQQDYLPLKNGAWLKLTVRQYVSPSGTVWHAKGLKPDRPIVVSQENLKPAERLDGQLKQAIETLKTLEVSTAGPARRGEPGGA